MQGATSRRTHAEMLRISENIKITQDLTAGTSGMPSPTVLNSDIFDTQKTTPPKRGGSKTFMIALQRTDQPQHEGCEGH